MCIVRIRRRPDLLQRQARATPRAARCSGLSAPSSRARRSGGHPSLPRTATWRAELEAADHSRQAGVVEAQPATARGLPLTSSKRSRSAAAESSRDTGRPGAAAPTPQCRSASGWLRHCAPEDHTTRLSRGSRPGGRPAAESWRAVAAPSPVASGRPRSRASRR